MLVCVCLPVRSVSISRSAQLISRSRAVPADHSFTHSLTSRCRYAKEADELAFIPVKGKLPKAAITTVLHHMAAHDKLAPDALAEALLLDVAATDFVVGRPNMRALAASSIDTVAPFVLRACASLTELQASPEYEVLCVCV